MSEEEKAGMMIYLQLADSLSVDAVLQMGYNAAEDGMLKVFPKTYAEGSFPTKEDLIDFTKVKTTGPQVYHFVAPADITCSAKQADTLAEALPTFAKTYNYSCEGVGHEWFGFRGLGQQKFMKDMIILLGANALTLSSVAITVSAMALF